MAKPRFPLPPLSADQQEQLQQWPRRHKSAQALALRARIILRLAEGHTSTEVAGHFHLHIETVSKWRERFRSRSVDGLLDEPRPGQPRKISDAQLEAVISRMLESKPADAPRTSRTSRARLPTLSRYPVRPAPVCVTVSAQMETDEIEQIYSEESCCKFNQNIY